MLSCPFWLFSVLLYRNPLLCELSESFFLHFYCTPRFLSQYWYFIFHLNWCNILVNIDILVQYTGEYWVRFTAGQMGGWHVGEYDLGIITITDKPAYSMHAQFCKQIAIYILPQTSLPSVQGLDHSLNPFHEVWYSAKGNLQSNGSLVQKWPDASEERSSSNLAVCLGNRGVLTKQFLSSVVKTLGDHSFTSSFYSKAETLVQGLWASLWNTGHTKQNIIQAYTMSSLLPGGWLQTNLPHPEWR